VESPPLRVVAACGGFPQLVYNPEDSTTQLFAYAGGFTVQEGLFWGDPVTPYWEGINWYAPVNYVAIPLFSAFEALVFPARSTQAPFFAPGLNIDAFPFFWYGYDLGIYDVVDPGFDPDGQFTVAANPPRRTEGVLELDEA